MTKAPALAFAAVVSTTAFLSSTVILAEDLVGAPIVLKRGVSQTIDEIMARDRLLPPFYLRQPRAIEQELAVESELAEDPNAPPPLSHWPPIAESLLGVTPSVDPPNLPQTVGTSFKAMSYSEGFWIPPDSMGDVGPTQILVHVNGRIKVFDKTGTLGPLNADNYAFWAPVLSSNYPADPMVRYDRLSGRWFVLSTDFGSANNQLLIAVSSGPTITGSGSFTFYAFHIGSVLSQDADFICDYPSLGVDANALYVGCNMFDASFSFYLYSSAYVIRKSSVVSGGPMVVTGFSGIAAVGVPGPSSPRGVDNDDPNWNEGYFIGTDPGVLGRINIRRISDPGGTPTLGETLVLPVSSTNLLDQAALGSGLAINAQGLRLFAASMHKNKITGVTSLWTTHSVETDTTCTPQNSGDYRRLGAKWYEIGNLAGTPTITQFGTLCTTAAGSATSNTQRGFLYPTVIANGQGHVALAASYASQTEFVGIAAAGRLRTDPLGGTRAPETIVLTGLASYDRRDSVPRNRWGDYSLTDVDPNDDQTIWTFQEYADTPANNWSVRAVQLKAPPPPTTATASNAVCLGVTAAPVTISGADSCAVPTCTNGLCTGGGVCPEFFDPGPDTGGPGYTRHLTATATGGITVNSASIVIPANPATQRVRSVVLSLNTTATTTGTKTISIINPDGQARAYNNVLSVIGNRVPASNTGGPYTVCEGGSASLNGTGSTDPDAFCGDSIVSYEWDLNGDAVIDVTGATPTVTPAQLSALGLGVGPHTITLKVTDSRGAAHTGSGSLTIVVTGSSCSDGNACTQTDTCQAGACVGANPVICSASDQCHVAGVCNSGTGVCSNPNQADGSPCTDGDACTQTDGCQAGVCVGANPVNCNDSNSCTSDSCNPGTGACTNVGAPDGTSCSDGNACTQTDSCQSAVCTGANPVVCTASDLCHVAGVCNSGTGACSNPNASDGTTCSDGNACTQTDACQSGVCTGSSPVVCSASDQCHVAGVCNTGTGVCSNPSAPNGTPCVDGNACTQTDTCQSGACTGSNPVICAPSDQCHLAGTCDSGTGVCSDPTAPDGTSCDDQDATTCGDLCTSAVCMGHAVTAPVEIDGSVVLAKAPTDTTISWTDAPGPYAVYRGSNGSGTWTYNHTCLAPGLAATGIVDPAVPAPGVHFYYLVTRFNECRESVPGKDGQMNPIPNAMPCPAP